MRMEISTYEDYDEAEQKEVIQKVLEYLDLDSTILIATDPNKKICFVNEEFEVALGYEEAEVVGKDLSDVISFNEPGRSFESLVPRKDGGLRFISWHSIPVKVSSEGKIGLLLSGLDEAERKNTCESMEKSCDIYSSIIEKANDGIFIVRDGVFKFVNKKMVEICGYEKSELISRDFRNLLSKESHVIIKDRMQKRLAGEVVPNLYEVEIIDKEGGKTLVEVNAGVIECEGHPADLVFLRDISERKQAEEESAVAKKRLQDILESMIDGVMISGMQGRFSYVNEAMHSLTGYTKEELLNKTAADTFLMPEELPKFVNHLGRNLAGGEAISSADYLIQRKDGAICPTSVSLSILKDINGKPEAIIAVQRDITDRKNAEVKLNELMEDLEHSNKELEQFAYVASHDLQEPLRMVSSYLTLLSRRYKGKLDSDADDFIHFAVDGATRMQRMINDLLTYSRVGSKGKPPEETDCEIILSEALSNLEVRIEESSATVTHDPLPKVMADDVQFVQLLQNLISNSIKYNDRDTPEVHLGAEEKDDEWVFSVKDNGIGIDPEYKDNVFEIFKRLQTKEEYEGSGIGLSVCKKIVERHGGRIWLESEPGEGTTFYFTVPKMCGGKD